MNLLIFGSSITWGAWDSEGGWAQRLKHFTDSKAIKSGFDEYTPTYCLGVSGDTTNDLLERFDNEVRARVNPDEKTLILIEIGINDSHLNLSDNTSQVSSQEYRENLIKLIDKSKSYRADLIYVGLTPVDDSKVDPTPWTPGKSYRLELVRKYEEILKEVASQQNVPIIHLFDKFLEADYKSLLTDGLHPNTKGHEIIFEEVKKYLMDKQLL